MSPHLSKLSGTIIDARLFYILFLSLEDSNALQSHFQKQKCLKENKTSLVPQQAMSIRNSMITIKGKPVAPTPAKLGWRFVGFFSSLCIVNLVCAIDATILAVALPVCIQHQYIKI
jgi:hypothetical protein